MHVEMDWRCTRCGNNPYAEGCGMPDYRVPVPYETGIRYEPCACPLELVEVDEARRCWEWTLVIVIVMIFGIALFA